jgi:hypothetical protein
LLSGGYRSRRRSHPADCEVQKEEEGIATLLITIGIEGTVCTGYALRYKKPLGALLLSCLVVNLVTQPILWIVLNAFFQHYLPALFATEIAVLGIEAVLLYLIPFNKLRWRDALILSVTMNLASFIAGWFLPV